MWKKIRDIICYAGVEKEKYNSVKKEIDDGNQIVASIVALVIAIALIGMTIASYFTSTIANNRTLYSSAAVVMSLVAIVVYFFGKGRPIIIYGGIYIIIGIMYAFDIVLATVLNPTQMSVSFIVILFAAPLIFTDMPIRVALSTLAAVIVFSFFGQRTQSEFIYTNKMASVIPYSIVSVLLSTYLMNIKIERYIYAQESRYLSESDQLTGLLNRRSYDILLKKIEEDKIQDQYYFCAFDVNGLKKANDTMGHVAGDELIIATAEAIREVFGKYGDSFRTGGDEFFAIIR